MALNKRLLVERIQKEYAVGMPDGLTEQFLRSVPILFERIRELETALRPFARKAEIEKGFNKELVEVYKRDCDQAFLAMSTLNSERPEQKVEFPA